MTGAPATPLTASDLALGFDAFVTAARRLEQAYGALQARAAAVDLELAETNRRLERTLAERETVFRALPAGVVVLDGGGAVAFANAEGERLLARGRERGLELAHATDGEQRQGDLCVRVRRVALQGGGVLLALDDRSRVERLEREIDRLDRLASLSELALGVAHEIKNPLNGVLGFAALIERAADPERIRQYATKVVAGVRQVDEIVRALLGFARPSGAPARRVTVQQVVAAAAAESQLPAAAVWLEGDATLATENDALVRVLANLFRNSVEAGAGSIRVAAAREGNLIALTVTDDGPGVPTALGAKVFEPFVTTKERGTGLGLSLASRVVAFLGGSLELLNPGVPGAVFRVRVPAHLPAALPAPAAEARDGV